MDFCSFVKDNKNVPLPSSFSSFFKGGNNVKVEGRNSSLAGVVE